MKNIATGLILLSLLAGTLLTIWGLYQMSLSAGSASAWDVLRRYIVVLLVGGLIIEVCARWGRVGRYPAAGAIAVAVTVFAGALWPLLVTLWFALASYVTGRAIISALKMDNGIPPSITALLLGAVAYGAAVGMLAHYPVNYPGVYGFALVLPVLLGRHYILEAVNPIREYAGKESEFSLLDLLIALIVLVHFLVTLMPEVGHDALAMHLFVPAQMASRHEWGFDAATYVWAVMPMMGDWLFSVGYMLAGETAARMINVGFIFILAWLVRDMVIWAGGSPTGARWAVLIFLTTPLTFTESSSLFIESVWATLIVAGSLSIFKVLFAGDKHKLHLPAAGMLLGGALSTKAVTFTILPVMLLFLVFRYRAWFSLKYLQPALLGLLLFGFVGAMPYITAWHFTGNPVFPFFNQLFQSPFYPAVNFDSAAVFGKGVDWDVLYQATFHTGKFLEGNPGASGFQWLLLFFPVLMALLFYRRNRGVVLVVAAVLSVVLTFQSVSYLRYIFPAFAWLAGGIGVALSAEMPVTVFTRKLLYVAGGLTVVLNIVFFKAGTYYGDFSFKALASPADREEYLFNRLPIRNAVVMVNSLNVHHRSVAVFSSPLTAGLNVDALYPNWYNYRFQALVNEAQSSNELAQMLLGKNVSYVILDDNWGVADKRKLIENVTENVAKFRAISIRKVKGVYQYQTELLINTDFSSYDGWTLSSAENNHSSDRLAVSVTAAAYQVVPVTGNRQYQNSVTAVCADQPGQGRLQVNWLDSDSEFISTDIIVFDCAPSGESHSMEVVAPRDAFYAAVYATGHTGVPVIYSKVSFKQ